MRSVIILLFCSSITHALQFPLSIPFQLPWSTKRPYRVAIIGAGAGGSSAAFWLTRAQNRTPEHGVQVDVFEKETYIGGRALDCSPSVACLETTRRVP